jgi:16S rRNA (cytosine1402-N4)-methyltransferase
MEYKHVPVMLKEVIEYLKPKEGQVFFDGTLGGGGYTTELARLVGKKGKVLATDMDQLAIDNLKFKIKNLKLTNIELYHGNFKEITQVSKEIFGGDVRYDGIVLDLGLSGAQLEDRDRGFSFRFDAPLDMAFGQTTRQQDNKTASILNKWEERDLEKIIREYGEERFSRRIAKAIVSARKNKKIVRTGELVEIIAGAVPAVYKNNQKIHFSTRTFQALRIATNDELVNLEKFLPFALDLLKPGGRLAVVSFHSLEDRIVKNFFKNENRICICPPKAPVCQCNHKARLKIISKKAISPGLEELKNNSRSRSAKLRVAEKIDN